MSEDFRPQETDPPNPSERDARGCFLTGNAVGVMTALRAGRAQLPEVFQVLDDRAGAFLEASLTDDGGREAIPARRLSQHEYRAALHLQILRLNAALELHGLFDRRGRLRVVWLTRLESLMREARAFDQSLGLTRRPKQVSLEQYVERTYRAANPNARPEGHDPGHGPADAARTDP